MILLLGSLLAVAVATLIFYIYKTRRFVRELEDSVRGRRRYLLPDSSRALQQLGLECLVRQVNELVDELNAHTEVDKDSNQQIEATLGSIQEAVLIFDDRHVIEYANESAERLFQQGRRIRGMRLESVLRSTSLLEFLDNFSAHRTTRQLHQISVEHKGEKFWFEASCSMVQPGQSGSGEVTLLVLHDITQLKRLEMIRRDFVANVSHELRTPLTIIKGFAETLVEDNATLPPESRARFLDKILNNAHRLHVLVEDLLTLSRLESKPDQVEPVVQSLRTLLEDVQESYRSRLEPGRQKIELAYDERIGDFAFDRFRINQVLDNLVENAFRYAPEFTNLVLRAELNAADGMVDCAVEDDGPGIPAKDVPHIFERFYRVDKGRSRDRGGTGLGLSITKHIILLHEGRVEAHSESGKGTRICFSLPYATETNALPVT
ncbi:sensor histidine kinase [Coraliomargarita parva]|uniref:sensor histidine kinase n=1 Tax=Coraliomargarita parva TaxID=3014050 RepID=UPI0022B5445A|nr:ATP-binding protein [Coraliomargarita parva]